MSTSYNETFEQKKEALERKIFKLVGSGKMKFSEHMDVESAKINLKRAVELEEYEAAVVYKKYIDNEL